MKWEK